MKKTWLEEKYKSFLMDGDGEWFVTAWLIQGIPFEYAVAWRHVILSKMLLEGFNPQPPGTFEAQWDWRTQRAQVMEIVENNLTIGPVSIGNRETLNPSLNEYCDRFRIKKSKPYPSCFQPQLLKTLNLI